MNSNRKMQLYIKLRSRREVCIKLDYTEEEWKTFSLTKQENIMLDELWNVLEYWSEPEEQEDE